MKSSLLDKYCGDNSASLIELCLDHKTSGISLRVGLELHDIGCKKNHLKELVDALSCVS